MRLRVLLPALLTATLISSLPGVASASSPAGYLGLFSNGIDFFELTVSNTNVVGVLYIDALERNSSISISTEQISLTGSDSGGNVTIYGLRSTPVFGTLTGSVLSLQLPQSDGSVVTGSFYRSSVAAYDQALAHWQTQINQENASAGQAAAQAAARQQREDNLKAAIDGALNNVEDDLSNMQSTYSLSGDLDTVDGDLSTVQGDLQTVQGDNSDLTGDIQDASGHSIFCQDVATEYQDAGVLVNDAKVMVGDARRLVGSDLMQDQTAILSAAPDWASYWKARSALPSYVPNTPVPPLAVAVAEGKGTIRSAVAHVNGDIAQANGYITQAYAMPNAAQKAMHCGPTRKVPRMAFLKWSAGWEPA